MKGSEANKSDFDLKEFYIKILRQIVNVKELALRGVYY